MVELDIEDKDVVEPFFAWWTAHACRMLSVPGFDSAQRFSLVHPVKPRSYAQLYSIATPEVMTSEAYRSIAGPKSSGMGHKFTNWHRNVFDGMVEAPFVTPGQTLVVLDGSPAADWPGKTGISWLNAVGLDQSVAVRGLAVTTVPDQWTRPSAGLVGGQIRLFEPVGERLTKAEHASYDEGHPVQA